MSARDSNDDPWDVAVLGAGGAGLHCAALLAQRGLRVTLIEGNDKPGKKILISGGGRCNFTNLHARPETYHSDNPHFSRSAFSRYSPLDFLAQLEQAGIRWHEKKLGQLFCDESAKLLLQMLVQACETSGVHTQLSTRITGVQRAADQGFVVHTSRVEVPARRVVLATGGLSIPTIGATGIGYDIARSFGLRLVDTGAALVPFTVTGQGTENLAGVAVDARVSCPGSPVFDEAILFTHAGLSGPAILQISTWWKPGTAIEIDLLPSNDLAQRIRDAKASGAKQSLPNLLAELLPRRLAQAWVERHRIPAAVHHLTDSEITRIADSVHRWTVTPSGTEGYRTAEVTRGGIDTAELSSKTMEAKRVPGLYAIGEVVDVTGWLGGYNFQWAWASAAAAAEAIAARK